MYRWSPVTTYRGKAGLALATGCALLAVSTRAAAAVVSQNDTDPSGHRLVYVDPKRVIPKISTLGVGAEYRLSLGETTGVRFEQFIREAEQTTNKDIYSYKLFGRIATNTLIFDWRPFSGKFRTSLGVAVNRVEASAVGGTTGNLTLSTSVSQSDVTNFLSKPEVSSFLAKPEVQQFLNEHNVDINSAVAGFQGASASVTLDYTDAITATAHVKWNRYAPYLGFGWGNATKKNQHGFFYSIDAGAMYIGKPKVSLSVGGPVADQINRYYSAELQSYVDGERQEIENKLSRYRVLPVISIGVSYLF